MKNLNDTANRYDVIDVNFKPEFSAGLTQNTAKTFFMLYDAGDAAVINCLGNNSYNATKAALWGLLFPMDSSKYVNSDLMPYMGNGKTNLFLNTLFAACGLHSRNSKINTVIRDLVTVVESGMLPVVTLGEKEVYAHGGNPDFAFEIYFENTRRILRVYNIPKQGYIDIEINN